jgi:hypothetical protein
MPGCAQLLRDRPRRESGRRRPHRIPTCTTICPHPFCSYGWTVELCALHRRTAPRRCGGALRRREQLGHRRALALQKVLDQRGNGAMFEEQGTADMGDQLFQSVRQPHHQDRVNAVTLQRLTRLDQIHGYFQRLTDQLLQVCPRASPQQRIRSTTVVWRSAGHGCQRLRC